MLRFVFFVSALGLFSGFAHAQEAAENFAPVEERKLCASPQESLACANEIYVTYDKRLNEKYKQATEMLAGDELAGLVAVQRSWIKFKGSRCTMDEQSSRNDDNEKIQSLACLANMTNDRTNELERVIKLKKEEFLDEEFSQFLIFAGKSGFDMIKIRNKFLRLYANEKEWKEYVSLACDYSHTHFGEISVDCMARMNYSRTEW